MAEVINEKIDYDFSNQVETAAEKVLISRNRFLVGIAAAAIGLGIIIPAASSIIDIFTGISISITTVILVVCFFGKKIKDVESLPLLLTGAIFLRLAIFINSAKYILAENQPSFFQEIGAAVFISESSYIIMILPAAAFLCLWVIVIAANKIENISQSFTLEILPLKKSVIDSKKNIGILTSHKTDELNEQTKREGRFYVSMISVAKIFKCEVIAAAVIVLIIAAWVAVLSVLEQQFSSIYLTKSAGATSVYLLQILATGSASMMLANRIYMQSSDFNFENDSKEESKKEDLKLFNSDFNKNKTTVKNQNETIQENIKEAEFESEKETFENLRKWSDKHYSKITNTLANLPDKTTKVVLLGSDSYLNLPVNIPVNVAIKLAGSKQKCLLVDLDKSRNAIEKVFADDNPEKGRSLETYRATCISNVSIFNGLFENIREHKKDFSYILVYAPNLNSVLNHHNSLEIINTAVLFTGDDDVLDHARQEFKKSGATIINIKN